MGGSTKPKQHQLAMNRCNKSWLAILCCCSLLAFFNVVRGGAGLPLGGDEEEEAASLEAVPIWRRPRSSGLQASCSSCTSTTRRVLYGEREGGGGIMPPHVSKGLMITTSSSERMMAAPAPAPEMHYGHRRLRTGQILGITCGAAGFVILCLLVVCIVLRRRSTGKQQQQLTAPRASASASDGNATPAGSEDSVIVRESAAAVNLLDTLGSPAQHLLDLDALAAAASSPDSDEHDILDLEAESTRRAAAKRTPSPCGC